MARLTDRLIRAFSWRKKTGESLASINQNAMRFEQGHALIVGVGGDLPNTVDDARGVAAILIDSGRCASPSTQVRVVTGPEASKSRILEELDGLAASTTNESTVVVYFSGHGYRVSEGGDWRYFIMPYGYDTSRLTDTAIEGELFRGRLGAVPAKKRLLVLDCCHAGGVDAAKVPGLEKAAVPAASEAVLAEGRGRVVLASSRADEVSLAGKPYSAFTLALLEALSGDGAANKDGYVRAADLAMYTRELVTKRTQGRQHPILHFEAADNFVVAYYAGGALEPKGPPFPSTAEIEVEAGKWIAVFSQPSWNVGSMTQIGA